MTIGERLAVCIARKTHVEDIKDPMVKVLWWKRWEQANEQLMHDTRFSPDHAHLFEAAEVEVEVARKARAKILTHRWALRFRADEVAA